MINKIIPAFILLWLSVGAATAQDAALKVNYVVASNKNVDFKLVKV